MSAQLSQNIEAILFHKAEAVSLKELTSILDVSEDALKQSIDELKETLAGRGVALMEHDGSVMLGTTPQTAIVIEKLIKDELDKDLGKAGLETLSIILYRGPVSRSEIDYIRGVNSSYILRNMVIRGLIERRTDPHKKMFVYKPTFELLSYLGITSVKDLPEYETVQKDMAALLDENTQNESKNTVNEQ